MRGKRKGLIGDVSLGCEQTFIRPGDRGWQHCPSPKGHYLHFCMEYLNVALVRGALKQPRLLLPWEFATCRALGLGSWIKEAAFSWRMLETEFLARYHPQVETSVERQSRVPWEALWELSGNCWNGQWMCDTNMASFVAKSVFIIYLQLWPLLAIGNCSERLKLRIKRHHKVSLNARQPGCCSLYWSTYPQSPISTPSYWIHLEREVSSINVPVLPSFPGMDPTNERAWSETYWGYISETVIRELWVGREAIFIFCNNFPQ